MPGELILVVEDNDKNRTLVRDVLTKGMRLSRLRRAKRASGLPENGARAWS